MLSLIAQLEAAARRDGTRLHSVQGQTKVSYEQFVAATHKVAHALAADGVRAGDRIAVWSRNDLRMLQAIYGALRAKVMFIPLNARNSVAENLVLLRRFECKLLFVQSGIVDADLLASEVPSLVRAVPFEPQQGLGATFGQWRDAASGDRFPDPFVTASDPAAIFPTSGTTGEPKGVVHTHLGISTMAQGYGELLALEPGSRHLVVGPITHVAGGLVYATTGKGCTQIFLDSTQPGDILDAIRREQANILFAPPTLVYGMLDEQKRQPRQIGSLQTLMYAGSPISAPRLRQAMDTFGPILVNVYSQTEVLYPVTSLSRDDHARIARGEEHLLASAGRATRMGELSIMDDQGQHAPADAVGEIVTRSLAGMQGFIGDAASTDALRGHGWHHTGDVGRVDAEGFLFIMDRKKDMIISGGFNVYSAEVEAVVLEHPAVLETAVVGLSDPKWGEAVTAVIVTRPGMTADAEALRLFCRERLGGVKSPKRVEFAESLPRNSAGKVLKRKLRQALEEGAPK